MIVERQPVPGTSRFRPIITDLRRTSQPVVRLLLDDLLEPAPPCPCRSPRLAVRGVEGRAEDIWQYAEPVLPRQVEDAMVDALGPGQDWRVTASPALIRIETDEARAKEAQRAIAALFAHPESCPPIQSGPLMEQDGPKRRRVRWLDC